jgi:protoporphyrin/coproporphyrin ferrochelatase
VRPFLENLFSDPAIIGLPGLIRRPLARRVAKRREPEARLNYAHMGGASPLLAETEAQAQALASAVSLKSPGDETRVFIAMRYWRPRAEETAKAVAAFAPDEIVLLPLYPQYSTTTSGSSFKEWSEVYRGPGRTRAICCYPTVEGLIAAHAEAIRVTWLEAGEPQPIRLLFSAHGLPERVIRSGDPYQAQIEATAAAVAAELGGVWNWQVCYQSRVGPLKWIGPSTDAAIREAGAAGLGVVVTPIAFVSEHVETLVELDRDYAKVADEAGCPSYLRAPALGLAQAFIDALAEAVASSLGRQGTAPAGDWGCPAGFRRCGRRAA